MADAARTAVTRKTEKPAMPLRRKIGLVALAVLGVLLAGAGLMGFCDVYQNHVAKDCGADCGTRPPSGTVRGGF